MSHGSLLVTDDGLPGLSTSRRAGCVGRAGLTARAHR